MTTINRLEINMFLIIGLPFLFLLVIAFARYITFNSRLDYSDRTGATVFFIVVGLPVVVAVNLVADFILHV